MRSALCEAVVRCHARRLRTLVAGAPVPAVIIAILVALAPFALARAGSAIGSDVAGAARTGRVADALVLGPMLGAAVAGAALAASLPGRAALGQHVAAGPVSDVSAVIAGLLVPSVLGAVAVLPQVAAVCVALGAQLPGGPVAGAGLACATLAACPSRSHRCGRSARGGPRTRPARARDRRRRARVGRRRLRLGCGGTWAGGAGRIGTRGHRVCVARARGRVRCGCRSRLVWWVLLAARRPEKRTRRARSGASVVRGRWPVPLALVAPTGAEG